MNLPWIRRPIYYGWIIAATLAVTQTISWGILYYSFSVFLTSFEQDLNASRAAITGAFSVALLCSGAIAVPVGRWIDHNGARKIMTIGSIVATDVVLCPVASTKHHHALHPLCRHWLHHVDDPL